MKFYYAEIKIILIEPRTHPTMGEWYRVKVLNDNTNTEEYYSWWCKQEKPIIDKLYTVSYTISEPDFNVTIKNIKHVQMIKKTKDGYIDINEDIQDSTPQKITVTTTPLQKSYSELDNENQTNSLLEIIISEVKELKTTLDDLSAYVYNYDVKEKEIKND